MNLTTKFRAITSYKCGHLFALPVEMDDYLRASHDHFQCPVCGQAQAYTGLTYHEKRIERLEVEAKHAEEARQSANRRAEQADHRARAYKGHLTRTKRRVGKGVCPCCNRTFPNLASHMEGQHPEYSEGTE